MKTLRILSLVCSLLICASMVSSCATPHQGSPYSQETKSDSNDMTEMQKAGASVLSLFESFAYSLGEEGYSFTP